MKTLSSVLNQMRKHNKISDLNEVDDERLKSLKLKMLRIQQGAWHQKKRIVILFEGFDAAGKGGAIRRIVEPLDPRGFRVYSIGPPTKDEQSRHYLYRFWKKLPAPGTIAIFDRSWYGRVLVEKVDKLASSERLKAAYDEINDFESMLLADGIEVIKIFLAVSKQEQLKRFEERLNNPYKQWKLTSDDLKARKKWNAYVAAADELLKKTNKIKWHVIPGDDKYFARREVLTVVTEKLKIYGKWMSKIAQSKEFRSLKKEIRKLEKEK